MDSEKYRALFVNEAREILSLLNKSLVEFEKNRADATILQEIFRQAHNLKGMSATMGYEEMSKLTHGMENVLDSIRHGRIELTKEVAELLFQSFDKLEGMIDEISSGKGGDKDDAAEGKRPAVTAFTDRFRAVLDTAAGGKPSDEERRTNLRLEEKDRQEIAKKAEEGMFAYRVTVSLAKDCVFKGPRAFVVVKVLEGMGKVVRSEYMAKQFENGKFGRHFGLFFLTREDPKGIAEKIERIPDVETILLNPLDIDEITTAKAPAARPPKQAGEKKAAAKRDVQMVRVELDKLEHLMNLVGELVINKIRLVNIADSLDSPVLSDALTQMGRLTDELRMGTMDVRLVPMDYIFNRFPRMVRDLAAGEGKEVDLVITGSDIGLDRTILDEMNEPLVHLLRNAVNHGLESPGERGTAGKNTRGTITLSARRERNFVIIEVYDDGKGMDPETIRDVSVRKHILSREELSKLSDEETLMLITDPGFSTSQTVTETSGRGVGMNAVKTKVESFGGSLRIASFPGKGSKFTMKLPLTMAIVQALLVRIADETYAVPMVNIAETIKIQRKAVKTVEHHEVIPYRNTVLPLVGVRERFGHTASRDSRDDDALSIVVAELGTKKAGLIVDRLLGQQEVVIKTLKEPLKSMKGVAGATILGDGKVAIIIDVGSLFQ